MPEQSPLTDGFHHIGLAVRDLDLSSRFFRECLGWRIAGEKPDYPAIFVTDGHSLVTLWQVEAPDHCVTFSRRQNVGLHHLALKVADRATFDALYARVAAWPGVTVEFAPEPLGTGPVIHCMINEPSGIRIEFDYDPRSP
jgi:catechol 2,3-dioxygenase-like lactoylglutathione lyase family enzyme